MLGMEGNVDIIFINIFFRGGLVLEMVGSCCGLKGKVSRLGNINVGLGRKWVMVFVSYILLLMY